MHFFYTQEFLNNQAILGEQESTHCTRVLRLNEGTLVYLTNGEGNLYKAKILIAHSKKTILEILEEIPSVGKPHYTLSIAIAPTKHIDRIEWFLEKSVEIGVSDVYLFTSRYSERKKVNENRLNQIIISAMKQSQSSYLPKLHSIDSLDSILNRIPEYDKKYIAHCYNSERKTIQSDYKKGESAIILIGPEGDFSENEVEMAISNGFTPVTLGERRLRTETAGLYSVQLLSFLNSH